MPKQSELNKRDRKIAELEREVEDFNGAIARAAKTIAGLRNEVEVLTEENEKAHNEIVNLRNELSDVHGELDSALAGWHEASP